MTAQWHRDAVLKAVCETGRATIAQEGVRSFGVGAESAAIRRDAFSAFRTPVMRVGASHAPALIAMPLEDIHIVGSRQIIDAVPLLSRIMSAAVNATAALQYLRQWLYLPDKASKERNRALCEQPVPSTDMKTRLRT